MERMFVFEKETKRTWRFQEAGEEPLAIGTLYVQKSVIKEKPKKIKVTVEVIE